MEVSTLDSFDPKGKTVAIRVDFNVPMKDGEVTDATRLDRALPSIKELSAKGARIVLLSHFGRPKGRAVADLSLAPIAPVLSGLLGQEVAFALDCIGAPAAKAIAGLKDGDILLLENTRFHLGEAENSPEFARSLAVNIDLYVNDAFSAAHRAHGSTEGIAHHVPAMAGRAMERELDYLAQALEAPARPVCAIVGGAKVSTKIDVLTNLLEKVDYIIVGGGMANTFLRAEDYETGASLAEPDLVYLAREIKAKAAACKCRIILPIDVVVAKEFKANVATQIKPVNAVDKDDMILDLGPESVDLIKEVFDQCKTALWNGPLGAFETPPFDQATMTAAQYAGALCNKGDLVAIAGGGDTVAALNQAGSAADFTYISTAGGAFLEWIEGKTLPGVAVLCA